MQRIEGTVSQWHEKGYGFVDLDDGRRAYVHNSACGGSWLQQGERISAVIVEDDKNPGKWQAQQVQIASGGTSSGVVQEWRIEGGYGFIQLDDGRRAYIHRSAFGGSGDLVVGTRVAGITKEDARNPGKWCVDQITEMGDGGFIAGRGRQQHQQQQPPSFLPELPLQPPQPQQQQQQQHQAQSGVVSEWNPRGFGFAVFEDGRRAYIHNSQCGGDHLQTGEVVTADLVPDERSPGKWQAHNVSRAGTLAEALAHGMPAEKRQRLV